jgi:hypothetical protein
MKTIEVSEEVYVKLIELANEFISEFDDKQAKDEWGSSFADVTNEPGNCAMVSETFIKWAKKKGFIANFRTCANAVDPTWAKNAGVRAKSDEDAHTVAQIGDMIVDFTAKQFDEKMPCPRIITVKQFDSEWEEVV